MITGALDIGGTHIRAALLAPDGHLLTEEKQETPQSGSNGQVVTEAVGDLLANLLSNTDAALLALGISAAGPLDLSTGAMVCSPNMAFARVPLRDLLAKRFSCPVLIMNDCLAGAYAEYTIRKQENIQNLVYITMSTGLGGGVVGDGRPIFGFQGNAAEIGHFTVDEQYQLQCSCGHTGHWEAYASGTGIPHFFKRWCNKSGRNSQEVNSAAELFERANRGDEDAVDFFGELARINGRGISDVIVAYAPEVIVFDGPVVQKHQDWILQPVRKHIETYLPMPELVCSALLGRAPLLGAGWYAAVNSKK